MVIWEYESLACRQMVVQLYRGLIKVCTNQTNILEGSTAVVEHKDKDQAALPELVMTELR
jgi:hypothetical protein